MLMQKSLFKKIQKIIPFNKKHSKELVEKLKDISFSTLFVGGIIALIQGGLITTAFLIFGIPGPFLWGFITAILSFLPIIGPSIIWIPASIIQFSQGDYWIGGGVLIFGVVLSNIDNFIRPYLGKSIGKIKPLATFIGIFIGLPLFGFMGIFAGPLLIAFSILVLKMFKKEYID
jgi:predicted PurR-regulated permease PerM